MASMSGKITLKVTRVDDAWDGLDVSLLNFTGCEGVHGQDWLNQQFEFGNPAHLNINPLRLPFPGDSMILTGTYLLSSWRSHGYWGDEYDEEFEIEGLKVLHKSRAGRKQNRKWRKAEDRVVKSL